MKSLLTAGAILGLIAQPVAPLRAQEVSADAIAAVVNGCGPDAAFGFRMDEPYEGGRNLQLRDTVAPFRTMDVIATARSHTLVGVDIWAYAPDDAGTVDERRAGATILFDEIDAAIEESGRFTESRWDEETETVIYSRPVADPESKVQMELSQLGVSVIVSCADETRRQLAMDEYLGRTRVERPVRPTFPAPVIARPEECDDPVRAEAIYDHFEIGGGYDVMNIARASQSYFEHLTQWYGQELIDKGVWTEAQRDAFQMSFLSDRTIMRELEGQLERLGLLLEAAVQVAERRDAGDEVGSCRAAVAMVGMVEEMGRNNERQWALATALYQAEALRLGVTLEN